VNVDPVCRMRCRVPALAACDSESFITRPVRPAVGRVCGRRPGSSCRTPGPGAVAVQIADGGGVGVPHPRRSAVGQRVPRTGTARRAGWNTNAATIGDLDGDGHLDLVFGNYFPDGARTLDPTAGRTGPGE